MRNVFLVFGILLLYPFPNLNAQKSTETSTIYSFKKGHPYGIGKWYQGREIAYVMGWQGIGWLERDERELEERTSLLIKNMNIKTSDVIADIGAGSGYHVFKMAPKASAGNVYAVDIQPEMLQAMASNLKFQKNSNIKLIQGSETSVNLPENTFDKILMVDVYHEFNFPFEMMHSIRKAMKKDGEIYLIEYRGEDPSVPIKKLHKMTEKQAIKEMKFAGFRLKKNIDNLPWQHCMVFVKAN